ncbi:phage baseplate assembly protein V [Tepidibacter sp. Z1-5]|uniref:phage baseplate assembly protein V n=1 Tax=Tepidibacter sp. Z1-5 TaxID=3134138 RepID=UPI0030BC157A
MNDFITYNQIYVSSFEFEKLLNLSITQKINEHTILKLRGIIPFEMQDSYVENISSDQVIEVGLKKEDGNQIIFKGSIKNIDIENNGELRILNLEGTSFTCFADFKKKKKTYQCKGMPYTDFFNIMSKSYNQGTFIDMTSNGESIEHILAQYNETDWDFLKRVASSFNMPLIANSRLDGVKIHIGLPDITSNEPLQASNYKVKKDIKEHQIINQNYKPDINENDLISYEVITNQMVELGNKVEFKNLIYRVYSSKIELIDGLLQNTCVLKNDNGFIVPKLKNDAIQGLSLEGNVVDISKDKIKVKLDIDNEFDAGRAFFYNYSTPYSSKDGSGFYFMPEKNDRVILQFPSVDEDKAYAKSSVDLQTNSSKRSDSNIKRISTKHGKEIVFKPGAVEIVANGNLLIKLLDDGGIVINSDKKITLSAQDDINILSGSNISIKGSSGVNLKQGSSNINIADKIDISGSKVNVK